MAATKQLKPKYNGPSLEKTTMSKADRFRASLDAGVMLDTVAYFGHHNIHSGTSDTDLMNRLLTDVAENSAFDDETTADSLIEEAMYARMDDIVAWVESAEFGERHTIDANFDGEAIGHGFVMNRENQTIREYTTDMLRLVLKQDNTNQYGFSLLTAYPSMMTPDIQPTGRDLTDIMHQTETYQKASPVKRAYLNYRVKPDSQIRVTYKAGHEPSDDCLSITVPTNNPDIKHKIRIKEAGASIATFNNGEKIESEFTKMRDLLVPKHRGKPNVFLNHPELRKAFCDAYPQHGQVVTDLQASIRAELPPEPAYHRPNPRPHIKPTEPMLDDTIHKQRVEQAQRVADSVQPEQNAEKGAMQAVSAFVLACVLVIGALFPYWQTNATTITGNAGIEVIELANQAKNLSALKPTIETEPPMLETMTTEPITDIENPIDIIEQKPDFFSEDIVFECSYVMPDDNMPYALFTPSSVDPTEPTALLVWLHGSGERNVDYNTFLTNGLPALLNQWDSYGFNAYILCPHLVGNYNNDWNTNEAKNNLQSLLDVIIDSYNIDLNNIALVGHSLGGQGALYMAHELPEYFSKISVLSGYNPGIEESDITMPVTSYIGTHDAGEDAKSIRYTMTTLATTFGDNNLTQIDASHSELPYHVFHLDTDGDKHADIINWLFAEKSADLETNRKPHTNQSKISSVPLFFQTDYPDIPYSKGTVATSGCGISCLSMVASYQTDIIYTPGMLAKYNDSGYDNGTRMENAAIALELHFEKSWHWSDVMTALRNDQLVIVLVGGDTIFTSGGHFIVLTGITDDGKIMVNDPYEPNYKRIGNRYITGFDESDITCDFNGAWIFDKKN